MISDTVRYIFPGVSLRSHTLFLLLYSSVVTAAISSSDRIILSDTVCRCTSTSPSPLNCKRLNHLFNSRLRRRSASDRIIPQTKIAFLDTVTDRFLDSTGFFDRQRSRGDDSSTIIVTPGKRFVLAKEKRVYTSGPDADSLLSGNDATLYPRYFSAGWIAERANLLVQTFVEHGFPFTTVVADFRPAAAAESLTVVFTVATDSLYRFSRPRLKGKFTVRNEILRNDLQFSEGDLFSREVIDRSLARLRSRAYIKEAYPEMPVVVSDSTRTDTAGGRIVVPLVLHDRSGMGLDGAVGAEIRESERPQFHGDLTFSLVNMFRVGEEAALSYNGDRERQRLDLSLGRPWLFGMPIVIATEGGLEIEREAYGYLYGSCTALYETAVWWRFGLKLTGNSISGNNTGSWTEGSYAGVDLVLVRQHEALSDGALARSLYIATGSGVSRKVHRMARSHIDFAAMIHWPLFHHQALMIKGFSGHIISREEAMLPAEMYRVGGNWSLRGYAEDEFSFRTVLRGQCEYLYYFQKNASLYLLCDGGVGFPEGVYQSGNSRLMLGYGAGFRIPVATGTFSVAWARNIADRRSPGRVHVRLQNSLSSSRGISLTGK